MENMQSIHGYRLGPHEYMVQLPLSPVSEELKEQALSRPGGRLYYRDPEHPAASHDSNKICGIRAVNAHGEIDQFWVNPDYEPSPMVLGDLQPSIHAEFDLDIWRLHSGYVTFGMFIVRFAAATFYYFPAGQDDSYTINHDEHNNRILKIYTAPAHTPVGAKVVPIPGVAVLEDIAKQENDLIVGINHDDDPAIGFWLHQLEDLWQTTQQDFAQKHPDSQPAGWTAPAPQ